MVMREPSSARVRSGLDVSVTASLKPLARQWDEIADLSDAPSPFLRSWWLTAVSAERPAFVLVRDGDLLLGGLPLEVVERRGIDEFHLLGTGPLGPHGLDVVARPGSEEVVARTTLQALRQRGGAIVDLVGTTPGSGLVRGAPSGAVDETIAESATIEAPGDYGSYLAARPRHFRQEVKRIERRLTERGVAYRAVVDPAGADAALEHLASLHRLRWRDASGFFSAFPDFARAARVGVQLGEVVFHEVVVEGRVLAALVTLDVGSRSTLYQMGRDPDPAWSGTGMFLKSCAIARSCEHGTRTIDFGWGSIATKSGWTDTREPMVRLLWAHGRGRALLVARTWKRRLRSIRSTGPAHSARLSPRS